MAFSSANSFICDVELCATRPCLQEKQELFPEAKNLDVGRGLLNWDCQTGIADCLLLLLFDSGSLCKLLCKALALVLAVLFPELDVDEAAFGEEVAHGVAGLGAVAKPVLHALIVEADLLIDL
jgi:hypothetical protein